jgi:pyruvate kinase
LAENYLIENGLAKSGEHLVIVTDILAGEDRFDSIQLRVIP